jgi:RNA recognition motif-containing protein
MAAPVVPEDRVIFTVHVRNLNFATDGKSLGDAFKNYGAIKAVRILTREDEYGDRRSRGFGFVQFVAKDGYDRALAETTPLVVDGRKLEVSPARPPAARKRDTAFIGLIPVGSTEQQIRDAFKAYTIASVRLIAKEDRKPFAFVQFATEAEQTAAVTGNRTMTINGGECVVRFARPRFAPRFGRRPRGAGPQRAAAASPPADAAEPPRRPGGPRRGGRPRRGAGAAGPAGPAGGASATP